MLAQCQFSIPQPETAWFQRDYIDMCINIYIRVFLPLDGVSRPFHPSSDSNLFPKQPSTTQQSDEIK